MLLVIDVGNTHTVLGVYEDSQLRNDWRIHTERNTTEDEFNVLINSLFSADNISLDDVKQTIISCVVPPIVTIMDAFCRKYLGHPPQWVNAKNCAGMPILLKNPAEVGADRIVNAVAAFHKYRTSLIVVDFGTATTFSFVSSKGDYRNGAIMPGVGISADSRCAPLMPAPATRVTLPSGAASDSLTNQWASGAVADALSNTFGMPRISRSSSRGAVS